MQVTYADDGVETWCLDARAAQRALGHQRAKFLATRVAQLRAADSLSDLLGTGAPGRWEVLTGDRRGQVSARLTGNWRLVVQPTDDPHDARESVAVVVIEIIDYH